MSDWCLRGVVVGRVTPSGSSNRPIGSGVPQLTETRGFNAAAEIGGRGQVLVTKFYQPFPKI